ncbi:unnamed protein product, partial [Vitis vinifera]
MGGSKMRYGHNLTIILILGWGEPLTEEMIFIQDFVMEMMIEQC